MNRYHIDGALFANRRWIAFKNVGARRRRGGFPPESTDFALGTGGTGLTLIGPSAAVMHRVGVRVQADSALIAAGVASVPGPGGRPTGNDEVVGGVAEEAADG